DKNANPKTRTVARATCRGVTSPACVTRVGPRRSAVSAHFLKSNRSLAKLVPIWMHRAENKAAAKASGRKAPWDTAAALPTTTGTTAAGKVAGREASSQMHHVGTLVPERFTSREAGELGEIGLAL